MNSGLVLLLALGHRSRRRTAIFDCARRCVLGRALGLDQSSRLSVVVHGIDVGGGHFHRSGVWWNTWPTNFPALRRAPRQSGFLRESSQVRLWELSRDRWRCFALAGSCGRRHRWNRWRFRRLSSASRAGSGVASS